MLRSSSEITKIAKGIVNGVVADVLMDVSGVSEAIAKYAKKND